MTYSPDGKWLAYVSDKSGREEIYVMAADGAGEAKQVTDLDALKSSYLWSPDSKAFAFTTADGKLYTITAEGKDLKELVASKYGRLGRPAWSPDGAWLAYSRPDVSRSSDIYLIPAKGVRRRRSPSTPRMSPTPRFSSDAKSLYFLRVEGDEETGDRPSAQIFCTPLEKIEKDPEAVEAAKSNRGNAADAIAEMRKAASARRAAPKEPNIDWAGLKRRTRQVTRLGSVSSYTPAHDGKTLVFVAAEGQGGRGGSRVIYTIQDDGKKLNRLSSSSSPTGESEGETPRGPRGFRGGGRPATLTSPATAAPSSFRRASRFTAFRCRAEVGVEVEAEVVVGPAASPRAEGAKEGVVQRDDPGRQDQGMGGDVRRRLSAR